MFICFEVEKVKQSKNRLLKEQVFYQIPDTNQTEVEGIENDGDTGIYTKLYEQDQLTPRKLENKSVFTKVPQYLGSFPLTGTLKSIADMETLTGINIEQNFVNTDDFHIRAEKYTDILSSFWYTVFTSSGLEFITPDASGADKGQVFKDDIISSVQTDKIFNYTGETGADILISASSGVLPELITDVYKNMAVSKEISRNNYIIFRSNEIMEPGDYVRLYESVRYYNGTAYQYETRHIVLSGRKIDAMTYEYTAVLVVSFDATYVGADVTPERILVGGTARTIIDAWQDSGVIYANNVAAGTVIIFDQEVTDTNSEYNPATGVFTPNATKLVSISAKLSFNSVVDQKVIRLTLCNGATGAILTVSDQYASGTVHHAVFKEVYKVELGTTYAIRIRQINGKSITSYNPGTDPYFNQLLIYELL